MGAMSEGESDLVSLTLAAVPRGLVVRLRRVAEAHGSASAVVAELLEEHLHRYEAGPPGRAGGSKSVHSVRS